jgi:hypothetical protein
MIAVPSEWNAAWEPQFAMALLVDGCIIDLMGVSLLWKQPSGMDPMHQGQGRAVRYDPLGMVQSFNELSPLCPVHLHTIQFKYDPFVDRLNEARKRLVEGGDWSPVGAVAVPATTKGTTESETRRAHCFPKCGHVHGYSREMDGQPCPMCRTAGPFVPVAFPFAPSICDELPTHIFNPCGHVASLATCAKYSSLPLPSSQGSHFQPQCPFCGAGVQSFSKLQIQCEDSQYGWEASLRGNEAVRLKAFALANRA